MDTIARSSRNRILHEPIVVKPPVGLPMGLMVYDKDMIVLEWNKQAEMIFGYAHHEIVGKNILDCIVPKDQFEAVKSWRKKIAVSKFNISTFYSNITKDQEFVCCNWHTLPIINSSDHVTGFLSLVEKALPEQSNLFSYDNTDVLKIFTENTTFNLVLNCDTQEIEYVNPTVFYAFSLLNNFNLEKGSELLRFIPKNDRFRVIRHFQKRTSERKGINISFNLQISQNVIHPIHISGHFIEFNESCRHVLAVKVLKKDSTFRKSTSTVKSYSRQLFNSDIDNLQQKNNLELLGDLTAGVVHELNQPLGVLRIILDNFKRKSESGTLTRDYLEEKCEMAQTVLDRMNELIDEIRMFRKDIRSSNIKKINLAKPLFRVLDLLKMAFTSNKIKITTDVQNDLPVIIANENWLTTIITNILANAKYSVIKKSTLLKDDSYIKEIKIYTWYDEEKVYLQIKDNGTGIKKKHLDNLFDPFFTTKANEGSGLGLAIVKNYIKELNGSIEIDTRENVHATFTISFPRVD